MSRWGRRVNVRCRRSKGGLKVLHVDDEPDFLASTKVFLERNNENFSVDTATSAEEGLEYLKSGEYDVVVSSYKMPGMDGLEFLRNLRQSGNTIPFIMFTDKGREEVAMEALNRGANGYPQKGMDIESMYGTLAHVIKQEVKAKRVEGALRESEERFRSVMRTAYDAIIVINSYGNIVFWNRAAETMFGYSADEIVGKPLIFIMPERFREDHTKGLNRVVSKGKTKIIGKPFETLGLRRDGSEFPIEFYVATWKMGEATFFSAIVRDVTERKKAEEERNRILKELEAKNTELERFTYAVSHDLRSPLITIQGFATIIREDLEQGKTEDMESGLMRIETAAAKMDHLLNDTLELSRIGRVVNPPDDVPFRKIVEDTLEQTAEQIKSSGVEVSVADDFPAVHVDRMRIEEVLVNLITNGIRYRGEQPSPKIDLGYRVEGESKETVFFVQDNGIGIDPSQHEKVFELFYRLDRSGEGTGVGLAIVKRIIEVHGGRIWIESEKGKGCTVCFTLPVV